MKNVNAGGTRGEVTRLLDLAWPVIVGHIGLIAMGLVDLATVGPLGAAATSAVGVGHTLSFAVLCLTLGASAGLDPLVTQAYGAGRPTDAGAAVARGAVLLGVLCVPITVVHLYSEDILRWLRQPAEVIPIAAAYCRILALSVVPFAGFSLVRQWLQGGGIMRPAMWVALVANVLHAVADLVLVRGWGPIPAFGVEGVAWATTASRWFMFFGLLAVARPVVREGWPRERVRLADVLAVSALALPVALQVGLEVWAFNAMSFFAGSLGTVPSAAHTAALSAASVSFMIPLGLSAAAATRVGNLVGAGADWRRSAAVSLGLAIAVMTLPASVFFSIPRWVGRFYNADPSVIDLVATVLPLAAAFQWFDGTQVVAFGVLRGLGDTRIPSLFNVVGYYAIGVPLGVALAFWFDFGLLGLWIGLATGLLTVAALLVARVAAAARAARRRPPASPRE